MQGSGHVAGVGVDGCAGGWFAVALSPGGAWSLELQADLTGLRPFFEAAERVLVDIPIGLPEDRPRLCDGEARRLLGRPRAASVFPVPCRQALDAADYAEACRVNERRLGRRLNRQTWNIAGKIAAMDRFLRQHPALRSRLREAHPELVFWALNRGIGLEASKRTETGRRARLALLRERFSAAEAVVEEAAERFPRRLVATDDIIDALALAVSARAPWPLATVPPSPPRDRRGLPMEIVYPLVVG